MLTAGQTLAGVVGLVAIGLSARALGSAAFGAMMLIHAYALVVANLVAFKAWHAVIRHGAVCLAAGRSRDLQALLCFASWLDVAGAALGTIIAVSLAPSLGGWLGWPEDAVAVGRWYGLIILFMGTATPVGVLRLFDRFDLLAARGLIAPVIRALGAAIAYAANADLGIFLAIWFAAAALDGVAIWWLGWRELVRRGHATGFRLRLRGLVRPHPGLWRLVCATNLDATLGVISGRMGTLLVGAMLGPASAGLYHVAAQFAAALDRPVEMLRSTIYPELARQHAALDFRGMRRLGARAAWLAGAATTPVFVAALAFGEPLLRWTVGEAFVGAAAVLVLLVLRQVLRAFGNPTGALLIILGRADALLTVNLVAAVLYLLGLVLLLDTVGLIGAGIAAVVQTLAAVAAAAFLIRRELRRAIRRPNPAPSAKARSRTRSGAWPRSSRGVDQAAAFPAPTRPEVVATRPAEDHAGERDRGPPAGEPWRDQACLAKRDERALADQEAKAQAEPEDHDAAAATCPTKAHQPERQQHHQERDQQSGQSGVQPGGVAIDRRDPEAVVGDCVRQREQRQLGRLPDHH